MSKAKVKVARGEAPAKRVEPLAGECKKKKNAKPYKSKGTKMLISRKATNPICAVSSATSTYSA